MFLHSLFLEVNTQLEYLRIIGKWESENLEECLQLVIATRAKVKFDCDRPFE
jgi:hypothetical protein